MQRVAASQVGHIAKLTNLEYCQVRNNKCIRGGKIHVKASVEYVSASCLIQGFKLFR